MNRFRLAYFGFFLYLGTFVPYWTKYLELRLEFADGVIGALFATLVLSGLAGSLVAARIADACRARRRLLRWLSAASVLACGGWLWVREPAAAALLAAIHGFLVGGHIPLLDASAIDALGARRSGFGRIRLYGTIGYALTSFGVAYLWEANPDRIVFALAGAMFLFYLTTLSLPDSQPARDATRPPPGFLALLQDPAIVAIVAASVAYGLAFAAYEAFHLIHFTQLGMEPAAISWVYPLAMGTEVLIFFLAPRLLARFSAPTLAGWATGVNLVRWLMMAWLQGPPAVLIGLQALHGISFGLYYAAGLELMARRVPAAQRTAGQGLFSVALASGIGVGGLLHGALRSGLSPSASFATSAGIAGVGLWIITRLNHYIKKG